MSSDIIYLTSQFYEKTWKVNVVRLPDIISSFNIKEIFGNDALAIYFAYILFMYTIDLRLSLFRNIILMLKRGAKKYQNDIVE